MFKQHVFEQVALLVENKTFNLVKTKKNIVFIIVLKQVLITIDIIYILVAIDIVYIFQQDYAGQKLAERVLQVVIVLFGVSQHFFFQRATCKILLFFRSFNFFVCIGVSSFLFFQGRVYYCFFKVVLVQFNFWALSQRVTMQTPSVLPPYMEGKMTKKMYL